MATTFYEIEFYLAYQAFLKIKDVNIAFSLRGLSVVLEKVLEKAIIEGVFRHFDYNLELTLAFLYELHTRNFWEYNLDQLIENRV